MTRPALQPWATRIRCVCAALKKSTARHDPNSGDQVSDLKIDTNKRQVYHFERIRSPGWNSACWSCW